MPRFKHSFWRYIPSTDERQSFFKFVESFETDSDAVPKFDDHNCIDHIVNLENEQMRVKNHSAPEYCVSKYVGWNLNLPPVEKTNKQEIYLVIHRSSFSHKKIEFDEFLEPKQKRYTQEEWESILKIIEDKFNTAKDLMKQGTAPIFKTKVEFRAFSLGRKAFFLYHIVSNYKFIHLIQKLNIGYTN